MQKKTSKKGPTKSASKRGDAPQRTKVRKPAAARTTAKGTPRLLTGGNPQIAKGDGDQPVQEYIRAMPGWKRDAGARLDAIIERAFPSVKKAVKWNSPFYGVEGKGWFLGVHCCTKYIKVAFFQGVLLDPQPPVTSKDPQVRYFHIYEHDELHEGQIARWVKQASELPGWGKT